MLESKNQILINKREFGRANSPSGQKKVLVVKIGFGEK